MPSLFRVRIDMKNGCKKITFWHLAGIFAAAFLMIAPLWIYGMPDPEDALRHFQFAGAVYDSLSGGNLYVQGEPNVNEGYGGAALRFYPPFTYYLLSAAYFVAQNWYDAAFLFFWFGLAASGAGAYFLAREWLSENFAFLAALLYTIDSFRSAQIQLSYAYAEFVAGGVLVFCFLFAARTIRRGAFSNVAGLAVSFALLLLTHLPLAIIGSFSLALFCVISLQRENCGGAILKLSAAALLGALAASFHWIRVLTEIEWINHSAAKYLTEGFYSYQNHFVNVRSTLFPGDLIFLNFLIFLVPSALILLMKSNADMRRKLIPLIGVTLFSIFMATSFSGFIWENVRMLQKIQFPWRWLAITSIGAAIITAAGAQRLKTILSQRQPVLILWISVCVIANAFFTVAYITGSNLMDTGYFLASKEKFNDEAGRKRTARYHSFWQTVWAKDSAFEVKDKIEANGRETQILQWKGFDKEFKISAGAPVEARVAQFYYPHWRAEVNGVQAEISKTPDGAILIPISGDEAGVRLVFVEPVTVKIFLIASCLAWFAIIMLLAAHLKEKFQFRNASETV